MQKSFRASFAALVALTCITSLRAQSCFFSADFEDGIIPAAWMNTSVTTVPAGDPVDAWTIGTAAQANANDYFPVKDIPIGNHFAMANDDALPCNCTMDDVFITTPNIDLTGRTNLAMECRVFHEMTLGGGPAWIEATTNGTDWVEVDSLPAVLGEWQELFIDLSAFDGDATFQLRFHWSDSGTWASGFAVDDVCLFERQAHDLRIVGLVNHAIYFDPFDQVIRSLSYRQIPLEQADMVGPSIRVQNRGTQPVADMSANVTVRLNGAEVTVTSVFPGDPPLPGATTNWLLLNSLQTDQLGTWEFDVELNTTSGDDNTADNYDTTAIQITGPGWDQGYSAMARDEGRVQGLMGSDEGFIAANRMEILYPGVVARGVSAVLGWNSQQGEVVRAILMDANFAFIDTSLRDTIDQLDIDLAFGGAPIYLPFPSAPSLAQGDYFVGLQRLSGSGFVSVATSGNCAAGASAFMEGSTFDLTWTDAVPMVRLHLSDFGVGVANLRDHIIGEVSVRPVPMAHAGTVQFHLARASRTTVQVLDLLGRVQFTADLGVLQPGTHLQELDAEAWPAGSYALRITTANGALDARFAVVH